MGAGSGQYSNANASYMVCIGYNAGSTGGNNNNTFIGSGADGAVGITNSTCIGYNSYATLSNQVVLGTSNETVYIPGTFNINNKFYLSKTLRITSTTTLSFPLYNVYYITPSTSLITITLPTPTVNYIGAKTTLRIVSGNTGNVQLNTVSGSGVKLYLGTDDVTTVLPYDFYTGGSGTTVWRVLTLCVLSGDGGGTYNWYQMS